MRPQSHKKVQNWRNGHPGRRPPRGSERQAEYAEAWPDSAPGCPGSSLVCLPPWISRHPQFRNPICARMCSRNAAPAVACRSAALPPATGLPDSCSASITACSLPASGPSRLSATCAGYPGSAHGRQFRICHLLMASGFSASQRQAVVISRQRGLVIAVISPDQRPGRSSEPPGPSPSRRAHFAAVDGCSFTVKKTRLVLTAEENRAHALFARRWL